MITGVELGMGRKLALISADEGAKVAICSRTQGFIDDVVAEISSKGVEAITVATDVGDSEQCQRFAAATKDAFGRIDGLVNSAYKRASFGTFEDGTIWAMARRHEISCASAPSV